MSCFGQLKAKGTEQGLCVHACTGNVGDMVRKVWGRGGGGGMSGEIGSAGAGRRLMSRPNTMTLIKWE